MGGKTAMEFATQYPELVSKLIVADIAPKQYPSHHQDILKALSVLDFDVLKQRGEVDEALSAYIPEMGVRQFLMKNLYWVEKGQLGLRVNLPVVTEHYDEVGKPLAEEAEYLGPTLFIGGEKSDYITAFDDVMIQRHFPAAVLDTVSGAGHWLHAENPSEFYEKVLGFLSS